MMLMMNISFLPSEILSIVRESLDLASNVMLSLTDKELTKGIPKGIDLYDVYESAASSGHVDILAWLYVDNRLKRRTIDCKKAARGGHLDAITWVAANVHISSWERLYAGAVARGQLSFVKQLADMFGSTMPRNIIVQSAAKHGHIDILEWIWKIGHTERNAFLIATKHSRFEAMKCIRKLDHYTVQNGQYIKHACNKAAAAGNLEILQWLMRKHYPMSGYDSAAAARHGHLHILKWLHEVGEPLSLMLYREALPHNHIHIIEWLWEIGMPVLNVPKLDSCTAEVAEWIAEHCPEWIAMIG